jgi:hypothetical protein
LIVLGLELSAVFDWISKKFDTCACLGKIYPKAVRDVCLAKFLYRGLVYIILGVLVFTAEQLGVISDVTIGSSILYIVVVISGVFFLLAECTKEDAPLQPTEDSSTRLDRLASGIKGKVQMLEHLVELYGGYMVVLKVS